MSDLPMALEGTTVVELPCYDPMPYFAASMAGKILADHGAEVIKIEPPIVGAADRHWGPFPGEERNPETNGLHLYLNTNKLGMTLDPNDSEQREILYGLLGSADLLINPNAAGISERFGLDRVSVRERFPHIIVVTVPFFSVNSPYRNRRGGDLVATHMSVVGYGTPMQQVADLEQHPPLRLAGRQSDYVTGYTAAAAALCALARRQRNGGSGSHVDVSQWLAMVQMCRPEIGVFTHEAADAPYRKRLLIRRKTSIQYMFPCKDGWVSCGLATNRHWRGVKAMMGNPEWAEGQMFNTFENRLANSDALEAILIEWFSERTRAEIFELAQSHHVPSFPVNSPAEVAGNPQYAFRNYFVDCVHPLAGKVRMPGAPIIFSRTPWRLRRPAPRLGEHNGLIVERFGVSAREKPQLTERAAAETIVGERRSLGSSLRSARLPFEGIRVLDFGWIYALPYATAWLAALGADVIKVESGSRPDLVRFLSGTDGVTAMNRSGIFNSINFSKRSLALNLGHAEARNIAVRLAAMSDIVCENFTAQTMKALALTYDDLRKVKPDLIMLSGTSLGQTGPLANTVGWGPTNQAFAGSSYLTGYPGAFPCAGGGTWPDFAVGISMLFALAAALHHRERTGEGQYVDVSMCEVVTSMMPEAMLEYFMNGVELKPIGNRDAEMAPHGVFPVKGDDQWIAIAIPNNAEFRVLCDALGKPALAADPRFATPSARLSNAESLEHEIKTLTRNFERAEITTKLVERNLCAAPVYSTIDLMADKAFSDSGMLAKLPHKECGERVTPVLPVSFEGLEPRYQPAPLAGEHTNEILESLLGLSAAEIERLRADKALL